MKKFFYLAVAACAALAACSKNEVTPVDVDQQITFQAVVNKASTKALIDGTYYKTDAPTFGTGAFYNTGSTGFGPSSPAYIPMSEVKYNDTKKAWTTDTPYYWPKNGTLTFFSFSPWSITTGTNPTSVTITAANGVKIEGYDVDARQTDDLMVADVITGSSNNTTYNPNDGGTYSQQGVATVFRHKLAQIVDVTFKTNQDYKLSPVAAGHKEFFINSVNINNYPQKGTYTSGNTVSGTSPGSWSGHSDAKSYEFFKESTSCGTEFGTTPTSAKSITNNYLLLLPQTLPDGTKIVIKYTIRTYSSASTYSDDVVTSEIPLKNVISEIKMNKKYTINFTVGLDQIYWAPSVENWETESVDYSPVI